MAIIFKKKPKNWQSGRMKITLTRNSGLRSSCSKIKQFYLERKNNNRNSGVLDTVSVLYILI